MTHKPPLLPVVTSYKGASCSAHLCHVGLACSALMMLHNRQKCWVQDGEEQGAHDEGWSCSAHCAVVPMKREQGIGVESRGSRG